MNETLRRVRSAIGRFVDLHVATAALRRVPRQLGTVAVTRMDNIGDFVLWLDGARAIRRRYPRPDHHVTLIASARWGAFADASGLFDAVIEIDPERFSADSRYRRMIFRDIAARGFETAINPTYSRSPWTDDLLVRATGAAVTIGQAGDLSNAQRCMKRVTDRWYSERVAVPGAAVHELEKNWHFAKRFDLDAGLRLHGLEPGMVIRPPWLSQDRAYFVLVPGAAKPIRLWPIERFGDIAARIHIRTGWTAIVCGAASDSAMAQRLIAERTGIPVIDACGRTSLPELAGVIAGAKLTVTNETGAVHVAAAVGAPAVAILGGGHFGRFLPYPVACGSSGPGVRAAYRPMPCYQCNWRCIHPRQSDEPGPCITAVTVEEVWTLVEPLLATTPHGG
jgi:ADP-heptose:LPS heptosyltransferase